MKIQHLLLKGAGLSTMLFFSVFSVLAQQQEEESTETTIQRTQTYKTETTAETRSKDTFENGPRSGIKGGLNLSNFITDEVTDKNVRAGFHVGVFTQLFSSEAFAIQPEVNYSNKGNRSVFTSGVIDQETKFNLNYIDVPILAVFKLGNSVEIHAGPYWAYLVGANIDTDGDLQDDFDQLDRSNFDNWDYGLVGGIGFNFNNLQIGARYNYGLNEIAESSAAKTWLGSQTKNSVGQIYMSVNLAD